MSVGYYIACVQEPDTCPECHKRPVYRGGVCKSCYEYVTETVPQFLGQLYDHFGGPPSPDYVYTKPTEYVYAVLAEGCNSVKIGITNCPNTRLANLQNASPFELELLGFIQGSYTIERCIHRELKCYRLKGEWFRYEGLVKNFVEAICNKDFDALESLLEV